MWEIRLKHIELESVNHGVNHWHLTFRVSMVVSFCGFLNLSQAATMKVHFLLASTAYHSSFDSSSVFFVWTHAICAKPTPSEGWRAHGDELWKEVEAGGFYEATEGEDGFQTHQMGCLRYLDKACKFLPEKNMIFFQESFGCFCKSDGWVWIKSFQFPIADIKRTTFNNLLWSITKINYFKSMFEASRYPVHVLSYLKISLGCLHVVVSLNGGTPK